MIHEIFWNYFDKGIHLVIMMSGRELTVTSSELTETFSLGHLTRRRQ